MEKEPLIRVTWHGRETAEKIPSLIEQAQRVEITLPPEYHHVLFRTLHPDAKASELEELDVEGDPELLSRIARIDGLEELAELSDPLTQARATLHIQSPAQITIILPGATRRP